MFFEQQSSVERVEAAIDACIQDGPVKEKCFDDLILNQAKSGGISHGFDVLAMIYPRDHDFAVWCHGYTHQLGELAFDRFDKGLDVPISSKTSYCGFGFYHGFLEKLLYSHGDLSEARQFCQYVDTKLDGSVNGVSFACYHGIGHGVVDGSDPSTWGNWQTYIGPGLALCEKISDVEEQRARCASGAFNALAIVMHTATHGFKADLKDPYVVCKAQTIPSFRKACYDQMNSYVVETTKTFKDALVFSASNAEPAYADIAIAAVASYTAQNALGTGNPLDSYIAACNVLPAPLNDTCARGFATGLIEFGDPGKEYAAAIPVCAAAGMREASCVDGIVVGAQDRLDPSALQAVCHEIARQVGPNVQTVCTSDAPVR